ncbi:MAG: transporter, binding subunit [Candidatus Brocadiaceae bacterium]|nr:transporter, binding subunit [Candidatus Brocadiaceae bacterium]
MPYSIETYNITKKYPEVKKCVDLLLHPFRRNKTIALSNVNIQIKKGELFGLLGSNGAGKTTLIKILCTLVLPTSGKAFVNGLDVTRDERKIRKTIGYVVSDERSFYWRLTGRQNLRFFAKLNNISKREADQRIESLLALIELSRDAERMFKDYSTGMRQKLAIARGLLINPSVLFMDEPTNGLDPITAQRLRVFIRKTLVEEEKRTVVFATHNLHEAEELCDRIAFIHRGEIKVSGLMKDIIKEFNTDKRYVMKMKRPDSKLLKMINRMAPVKHVTNNLDGYLSDTIQIEVGNIDGDEGMSKIIKEVVDMGGKIYAVHEKDISLGETFSKIVDTGNAGDSV